MLHFSYTGESVEDSKNDPRISRCCYILVVTPAISGVISVANIQTSGGRAAIEAIDIDIIGGLKRIPCPTFTCISGNPYLGVAQDSVRRGCR